MRSAESDIAAAVMQLWRATLRMVAALLRCFAARLLGSPGGGQPFGLSSVSRGRHRPSQITEVSTPERQPGKAVVEATQTYHHRASPFPRSPRSGRHGHAFKGQEGRTRLAIESRWGV
jgi:hypothetical protein